MEQHFDLLPEYSCTCCLRLMQAPCSGIAVVLTISQLAGRGGGLHCDDHICWGTVTSTIRVTVSLLIILYVGP